MTWLRSARPQLLLLALAIGVNLVIAPDFLLVVLRDGRLFGGLIDVLNRAAPVALLAIGMAPVIATRGIDLSVGAVMAIAGAVAAWTVNADISWAAAVILALAAGLACGLWNGGLVAGLGMQPIVATLILMVAGRGVAQLITEGRILTFNDPHLAHIGSGAWLGLPAPVWLAAIAAAMTVALVRASALGLFIEAIGTNPRASRLSGVPTTGLLLGVYAWSGLMAAIAGLVAAGDISGADANNAGLWLELDAILAVVVGGGSLFGGRFSITRAVLGALVMQALRTAILRSGLPPELNLVLMASVVALVLAVQSPALEQLRTRLLRRPA